MICVDKCPYNYKYFDKNSKECLETCPNNYYLKKIARDNNFIFRCSDSCINIYILIAQHLTLLNIV